MKVKLLVAVLSLLLSTSLVVAQEEGENASNPLAKVKNTDVRIQYFDLDVLSAGTSRTDYWIDGAFMAGDKLKIKYEVHFWDTDLTGAGESDFESIRLKGIYFPRSGKKGRWNYRLAVGMDWIIDFDNLDRGIGQGADQVAPFVGVALVSKPGMVWIPLIQHFISYSGTDVNTTAARLIALKTLPAAGWAKFDIKVPIDWENDNAVPASFEVQFGRTFRQGLAAYFDVQAGIGDDRLFDWGVGVGVRFSY